MAYRRIHWKDRRVERPRTYTLVRNSDGSQTLTDAPGEITQEGTPLSAANLNVSEEALLHYSVAVDMMLSLLQAGAQNGAQEGRALTDEEIDQAIMKAENREALEAILGEAILGEVKLG